MKQSDLKKELEWVISHQTQLMDGMAGSDNPQTVKMHGELKHSTAAFQAVLDRMNGGMDLRLFYS